MKKKQKKKQKRKSPTVISPSIYGTDLPLFMVTFVGDYATITTCVEASNEDSAIVLAENMLTDYYDWDMSAFGAEATIQGEE
jgi:hypothetical protein